jgi:hypothetical protein
MMLRYFTSTLAVCALASTASVFGQQAPAPAPQAPAAPAQKEEAPKAATLTGCVMEAKTTDGGTAYVLDKAEGGSDALYVLIAATPSELATNVNKKVEVTGAVRQPPAAPAGEAAANQKVLRPAAVQVESVKVVADTCK